MGYDVIPTEVAVFDKSQIKELGVVKNPEGRNLSEDKLFERIEAQLTALWESAHQGQTPVPPQEPPPRDRDPDLPPEDPFERNRALAAQPQGVLSRIGQDTKEFIDKAFVPISTRLSKINEGLKHKVRQFDFQTNIETQEDLRKVESFLKEASVIAGEEYADLDFALKNRDAETVDQIVRANGLTESYQSTRAALDALHARAEAAGIDVGYLQDYWPRRVKDASGFMAYLRGTEQWSAIAEAIARQEKEQGYRLDEDERAMFVNQLIRGTSRGQIKLTLPGNVKDRLIETLTPEMNRFYKDSSGALIDYISAMNIAIASRELLGTNGEKIDDSIGAYIDGLVQRNEIDAKDESDLRSILKARLEQRGTHGMWRLYKNLSYIYSMGSPISAITQIGDFAFVIYQNGYWGTAKALAKTLTGQKVLTKEDLGIDRIAQEFAGEDTSSKAVSMVFKAIGLEGIDAIGKETIIQGAYDRYTTLARNNPAKLRADIIDIFGDETEATIQDLQNGELSTNVKYLMFSQLADVQPISLSEMPEYYLNGGNLRIFYMLKTYTLKLLDVYHNQVFRQIQTDPKAGLQNFIRLTSALMLTGMTADAIKDLLLGRFREDDEWLSDLVMDNILKLMAFSKWQIYKARQDGLMTAVMQSVLPPVPFFDDVYKDVVQEKELPDMRIWGRVPIIGKFYYWWFGGGAD